MFLEENRVLIIITHFVGVSLGQFHCISLHLFSACKALKSFIIKCCGSL